MPALSGRRMQCYGITVTPNTLTVSSMVILIKIKSNFDHVLD